MDPIAQLYANIGQTPDAGGLAYWQAQLASGVPLSDVAKNFYTAAASFASTPGYSAQAAAAQALLGGSTPTAPAAPQPVSTAPTSPAAPITANALYPSTNPIYMNGAWNNGGFASLNSAQQANAFVDPFQNYRQGVVMPDGRVFFSNASVFGGTKMGTADVYSRFATAPDQYIAGVTSPGVGDKANYDWIAKNVKQNVTYNGQQGFSVAPDQVQNLYGAMVQDRRDNSKYAVKKTGNIFGSLLTVASFLPGMQWLAPYAAAYGVAEGVATGNWGQAIGSALGFSDIAKAVGVTKAAELVKDTLGVSAQTASAITAAAVGGTVAGMTGGDILKAAAISGGINYLSPMLKEAVNSMGVTTDADLQNAIAAPVEDAQPLWRVNNPDGTASWVRGGPSVNGYATLANGTYINTGSGNIASPQEIATAFPNGTQPPAYTATATPNSATPTGTDQVNTSAIPAGTTSLGTTGTGGTLPTTSGSGTGVSAGTAAATVAAGGAAAGATSSILNSTTGAIIGALAGADNKTGASTTEKNPWSVAVPYLQNVLNLQQSNLAGNVPFTPTDLVAPLNQTQVNANTAGLEQASAQKLYADEIAAALKPYATGGMLDPATNPYAKAALEATLRQITDKYQTQVMPSITNNAVMSGGVGGSRQGVAQALASKDYLQNISDTSAKFNYDLYNQNFNQMTAAIGQMPQVFNWQQQPYVVGQQVGQQQQQNDQATKDAAWQLWQAKQTMQQNASNTIGQIGGQGSATTTQYPQTPQWQSMLGGAIAGSQLFK